MIVPNVLLHFHPSEQIKVIKMFHDALFAIIP